MKKIDPAHLIPMDIFCDHAPITIDLVYANADHPRNIFDTALYTPDARLWAYKDVAAITLLAARLLQGEYGYGLEIQDCLRTIDAQEIMAATDIVRANPQWQEEPDRLLAPPGAGAHPRAMAIDVALLDTQGNKIDMGTPFDHMDVESHRNYQDFSSEILNNRQVLETAFVNAARRLGHPFLPLPSEWWDFRFPADYSEKFEALYDKNLPPQMQMTGHIANNIPDFGQEHFDKLAEEIITVVDANI